MKHKRLRRVADLNNNLRRMRVPRQWLAETVKLLGDLHAGTYAAENLCEISARYTKWFSAKRGAMDLRKPWRPQKRLAELPPYSQAEAWGRRLVVETYLEALANGLSSAWAERIARMIYLAVFNKPFCGKSVRRLVATVERRGGIVLAPIEAFATNRSVPHGVKPARPQQKPAKT